MSQNEEFAKLEAFLERVPSVRPGLGTGHGADGLWWVKFRLDTRHALAWSVVQKLGCVLNYLSVDERLPTAFYPVSPAPYLNGGPGTFLSWIIEATDVAFTPDLAAEWLEARLPNPVDDLSQWSPTVDEEEQEDAG